MFGIGKKKKRIENLDASGRFELHESLKDLVKKERINPSMMSVALVVDESIGRVAVASRSPIFITDGKNTGLWEVDSLRSLFRGDEQAPSVEELSIYPPEFAPMFFVVESGLMMFYSDNQLPATDGEFLDIYSALRRRPDGRSLGSLHDLIWINTAFMLGKYRCSESLYTAVMKRLERSARTFKTGMSSRNYFDYIQSHLGGS